MSFYAVIARAGPPVGAVFVGWASTYIGFEWPILATVVVTAVVGAYVFRKRRGIEQGLDRDVPQETVTVPAAEASPTGPAIMEKRPAE
jgi:UPF0716 family protein affecting phage T7 exclusion